MPRGCHAGSYLDDEASRRQARAKELRGSVLPPVNAVPPAPHPSG